MCVCVCVLVIAIHTAKLQSSAYHAIAVDIISIQTHYKHIPPTLTHTLQVKDKGIHVFLSPRAEGFIPQMLVSTHTEVHCTYTLYDCMHPLLEMPCKIMGDLARLHMAWQELAKCKIRTHAKILHGS